MTLTTFSEIAPPVGSKSAPQMNPFGKDSSRWIGPAKPSVIAEYFKAASDVNRMAALEAKASPSAILLHEQLRALLGIGLIFGCDEWSVVSRDTATKYVEMRVPTVGLNPDNSEEICIAFGTKLYPLVLGTYEEQPCYNLTVNDVRFRLTPVVVELGTSRVCICKVRKVKGGPKVGNVEFFCRIATLRSSTDARQDMHTGDVIKREFFAPKATHFANVNISGNSGASVQVWKLPFGLYPVTSLVEQKGQKKLADGKVSTWINTCVGLQTPNGQVLARLNKSDWGSLGPLMKQAVKLTDVDGVVSEPLDFLMTGPEEPVYLALAFTGKTTKTAPSGDEYVQPDLDIVEVDADFKPVLAGEGEFFDRGLKAFVVPVAKGRTAQSIEDEDLSLVDLEEDLGSVGVIDQSDDEDEDDDGFDGAEAALVGATVGGDDVDDDEEEF